MRGKALAGTLVLAVACSAAWAYIHPTECFYTVPGMLAVVVNENPQEYAGEPPNGLVGEPGQGASYIIICGGPVSPEVQTQDYWQSLLESSQDSGGGTAYKEGEAWHSVQGVGIWSFDHHVEQNWNVCAKAETFYSSPGPVAASSWAKGLIRDDRAQTSASLQFSSSGNDGLVGDTKLIYTAPAPDTFDFGGGGWVNICATTAAHATGTWSSRANSHGGARADDDIVIVIGNLVDIG